MADGLIDRSFPSASSCKTIAAVKALVLLPICHSCAGVTGTPPPNFVVPRELMFCGWPCRLMLSEIVEMCSIFERAARCALRSCCSAVRSAASDSLAVAPVAGPSAASHSAAKKIARHRFTRALVRERLAKSAAYAARACDRPALNEG